MSAGVHQSQPPEPPRRRSLHWGVVVTLWVVAALWIIVDPLTGTHASPTQRAMENVALLLVAAACTAQIVWLIQYLVIAPHNTGTRSFELGYYAGRADALNESRPSLGLVSPFPGSDNQTGT